MTADQIACVGFSGQMHGAVLLDETDKVIHPALIWCDQRTAAECDQLNVEIGRKRIIEYTCNPALTNFTLTKLMWVRNNEPQLWQGFRRFLLPKDYVLLRLTGEHAIDVTDASGTLLLDVRHRCWSDAMLSATRLDKSCVPTLFESSDVCGRVNAEGAKHTGLRVGTPVVAGAGDQAAGAVGMGVVGAGTIHATIGTSGVVFASTDHPAIDPQGRLHTFCSRDSGAVACNGSHTGRWAVAALVPGIRLAQQPRMRTSTLRLKRRLHPAEAMGCCGPRTLWASAPPTSIPMRGARLWDLAQVTRELMWSAPSSKAWPSV